MSAATQSTAAERTAMLYTLAQRPCGVTSAEAIAVYPEEFSSWNCSTMLGWMANTKRVERRAVREGKVKSRYFADPAVPLHVLNARLAKALHDHQQAIAVVNRNRKADTAPSGPAVQPESVKPQVCSGMPAFDARYQADPRKPVPSVINSAECRPWAVRAIGC